MIIEEDFTNIEEQSKDNNNNGYEEGLINYANVI